MYFTLVLVLICFSAGWADPNNLKIIGGRNTTISKHPYQVSLTLQGTFSCSGVILNKQWVLTTASCISGVRYFPDDVLIRGGSDDYETGGKTYAVDTIFMNEQFTFFSQDYDIAVIKMKEKFTFGKKLKPIKLATKKLKVGKKAVISGWGASKDTFYQHQIKELDVKVISTNKCAKLYQLYTLSSREFCAGSKDYGACWNDLADPLVVKNRLYGLLSFNQGCFDTYYPSVYTNVPALEDWISDTIKNNS